MSRWTRRIRFQLPISAGSNSFVGTRFNFYWFDVLSVQLRTRWIPVELSPYIFITRGVMEFALRHSSETTSFLRGKISYAQCVPWSEKWRFEQCTKINFASSRKIRSRKSKTRCRFEASPSNECRKLWNHGAIFSWYLHLRICINWFEETEGGGHQSRSPMTQRSSYFTDFSTMLLRKNTITLIRFPSSPWCNNSKKLRTFVKYLDVVQKRLLCCTISDGCRLH